uniref:Uncharacterized protein n=1 Tax=Fagus sylvatica TaxID=28930 RepID=A0A2N9GIE4_FAGSY
MLPTSLRARCARAVRIGGWCHGGSIAVDPWRHGGVDPWVVVLSFSLLR